MIAQPARNDLRRYVAHRPFLAVAIALLGVGLVRPAQSSGQAISTIAGQGEPIGTNFLLSSPAGVTVDAAGTLFIADTENHRVVAIDSVGLFTVLAGTGAAGFSGDGGPSDQANLDGPAGLAVDESGNLYIADRNNHRVRRIDGDGLITTVAGIDSAGFGGDGGAATDAILRAPTGLYIDEQSNLYIADTDNHRIRRVDADGLISTIAGNGVAAFAGDSDPATTASLSSPTSVVVDTEGNILIADAGNHRIRRISPTGNIFTSAGVGTAGPALDDRQAVFDSLNTPSGMTIDGADNIYFADRNNHRLRRIAADGTITTLVGDGTANSATEGLSVPAAVAVDADGVLFIADTGNNRVSRMDTSGVTIIAGGGTVGDGDPAVSALLREPAGVFVDDLGAIYIADTNNHRIRRVDTDGVISTIAGTGSAGFSGDGGAATSASLSGPTGVFVDAGGTVYIADTQNHRIPTVDAGGDMATVAGTGAAAFAGDGGAATAATLNLPAAIYVDGSGVIFIADSGNHAIRRVSTAGIISTVSGTGTAGFSGDDGPPAEAELNFPSGIFVDSNGDIFIADTGNHRIRHSDGTTITTFAGDGVIGWAGDGELATAGRLGLPGGLWQDGDGNLIIADRFNQRVRSVSPDSVISTIAGDGAFDFTGDRGPAIDASIRNPRDVAVDNDGNIYIADASNDRIRRIFKLQETTTPTALSGTAIIAPGDEILLATMAYTGDGINSIDSVSISLSDLSVPTGLTDSDFTQLRLYSSAEDTLDDFDDLLGTLTADSSFVDTVATTLSIAADFPDIPAFEEERFYLVTAVVDTVVVEDHAFKIGLPSDGVTTSLGEMGTGIASNDFNRVEVDIVATHLEISQQPDGSLSGLPLLTQPVVTALDDYGNVDLSFSEIITLTETSAGTLTNASVAATDGVATFGAVTYTASADNEAFVLIADDETGGTEGDLPTVQTDQVISDSFNNPPVLSVPDLDLTEDSPISIAVADIVADPDDNTFTWEFAADHISGAAVGDSLTFTPEVDWFGSTTVTITASDTPRVDWGRRR